MSDKPISYDALIKTWEAVSFGHDAPNIGITSRKGLRFLLRHAGWDRNKIRRYMYTLDQDAKRKQPRGIPSPGLWEQQHK